MSDETPSKATHTVAQELGADPHSARDPAPTAFQPAAVGAAIRDLTRAHPFAMLAVAFMAGVAWVGRLRR